MEGQAPESWDLESSIRLAKLLPSLGIDVLDVSSAGNHPQQRIQMHNAYQTDLAGKIRTAVNNEGLELVIAAVGQITQAEMARELVQGGKTQKGDGTVEVEGENGTVAKAELVLAARQFLRDPQWVLSVARELNVDVKWANQYERAKPKPATRL
jgi:2,4-dienoyl-CoA reductase-like NADH-dependent reductase (Old Yellow Enzyme family)